ncbi:GNAT family N-acetyltransferase [Flavobacterium aestivum]|uniref:GNAT family N-acetyltransferase n=1 Tax=Flavobacterium aestivum TaxID=3003257 RepID=UPI0022865F2B|nr:GNAT family N-acetyltransferase [Flavobacterium aestivum]
MEIKSLQDTEIDELVTVFNQSFSDYIVPFKITKEQLKDKIKSDNIKLEYSVGAFEDNQLIGFILNGFDFINGNKIAYNAGIGVIPEKRGNKVTIKLFEHIIPKLKKQNVTKIKLEVITENEIAFRTYKKIGFEIIRELNCYKGHVKSEIKSKFKILPLKNFDWELQKSFWDWNPTWQNSINAAENISHLNIRIGAFDANSLIGYLIYNPNSNRIQQFAVNKDYRNQGVGKQLFQYITGENEKEFSLINIPVNSLNTNHFLSNLGLEVYIKQYEMELSL